MKVSVSASPEVLPRSMKTPSKRLPSSAPGSASANPLAALASEYYRSIGIDHVVALPIHVDDNTLVSFVLNRSQRDFSDRDCVALDLVREPLARMYRQARAMQQTQAALTSLGVPRLTTREREVMHRLAAGKTDRDIAAVLGCSHRSGDAGTGEASAMKARRSLPVY